MSIVTERMCAAQLTGNDGAVCSPRPEIQSGNQKLPFSVAESDREWLYLRLTGGVTKYKFLDLISRKSITFLRSATQAINIEMPEDMEFSRLDVKVCKLRWLMKVCVILSLTLVNLQMFEFTIVSNTIIAYYHTTEELVNWTSLIYMLCYVILTFPVTSLLDNRFVVS